MAGAPRVPLYAFESRDALARFSGWIPSLVAGGIGGFLAGRLLSVAGAWAGMGLGMLVGAVLVAGLKASITVTADDVVIVKKCFFVPYKTYRAREIDDVWFGGDWGLEEGAIGVVVQLGTEEVHIGTGRNMRELHDALWPLSASYRTLQAMA
jgi:hypothetical protein